LPFLVPTKPSNLPNRRVRTRTHGGVGGVGREAPPYPDLRLHYGLNRALRIVGPYGSRL
jgi:hypothetical protein